MSKENIHSIKKAFSILAVSIIFGITGLIIFSTIGGNFMTEFKFAGVAGYEATGIIGFIFGVTTGAALGSKNYQNALTGGLITILIATFLPNLIQSLFALPILFLPLILVFLNPIRRNR